MGHLSIFSYFLSICSVLMGLFKMFVYKNGEKALEDPVNAYVGGDAYNYIINAGYATAWFVLAIFFLIAGFIFYYVDCKNLKEVKTQIKESLSAESENTLNM